ncbi:endoribonuclease YbeY isoform X2 [Rana temporaria]|uniref:endoribonuclease YbeY isoform X2 n=1 Tax=Rana temporaria TaxID=8407 RepID=UPI001AAC74D4|nr:endoribonuclease YbeY isoform X2 [Rana temporaria]
MFPPPAGRRWRESCSSQIGESSSEMMSLLIRNLQSVVHVRRAPLRKNLEIARSCLRVRHFDVGVICVNNAKIRQLNKSYRKKDTATDVLSFPFHEDLHPEFLPKPSFQDEYNLGDIYLSVEFIYKQCQEAQEDFNSNLTMFAKENEVLCEINKATGSALKPLTTNHFDH